ncbi:MAG TPA: ABC transporter permease, partial [Devosiaceae bacterium]|nr:ABC transporter permease [Devosiaceae bacterium]
MGALQLDNFQIGIAASGLLITGALSVALQLGLARTLIVAALRMIVQLALVSLLLGWAFSQSSPWVVFGLLAVMGVFAAYEVRARQKAPFMGAWSIGLGGVPMVGVGTLMLCFTLTAVVGPDPWYSARYAIPLFGMLLGNSMTGVALALDQITRGARQRRAEVNDRLALGMTRTQAMLPLMRDAMSTGLMPIINSMAATGLVFLLGMMTGQILEGADPQNAVRYQIMIMFAIAGTVG